MQAQQQQPIHKNLMTSALPSEGDFSSMAESGYEMVISLCEPTDSVTLVNEDALVTDAGMRYMHLAVDFDAPSVEDYELLRDILNVTMHQRVWLHCTKNYRVSAMMYLYSVIDRGVDREMARMSLESIWQPTEPWESMITQALDKYVHQYL